MSNTNQLGSEEWAVVAKIDPDANTANTYYSAPDVDMSLFEQVLVVCSHGALGSGGTVAYSLVSGTSASPTTAVSGKSATTISDSSPTGSNDDGVVLINCRGDELTEGHRYLRAKMVVATATSDTSVHVLAKGKSLPSSDNDDTDVVEIVA